MTYLTMETAMTIKVKRLDADAIMPTKGTLGSSGYDLYALKSTFVEDVTKIPTGIAIEIPKGYEARITLRSSSPAKHKITSPHSIGIIDSDYRGELIILAMPITGYRNALIAKHTRIAQITFHKVLETQLVEVDRLSKTERNEKGFGSTGL